MTDTNRRFEAEVLPYLDAAYSLARWLVRDEHVAEDVVQDAFLRAFRYFGTFAVATRAPGCWALFAIAAIRGSPSKSARRNSNSTSRTRTPRALDAQNRPQTPETILLQKIERAQVTAAIARLPLGFREVLVLREIEELSYDDIARVLEIPKGTVMSRLSRARRQLQHELSEYR